MTRKDRVDEFMKHYEVSLAEAIRIYPKEYEWRHVLTASTVCDRMRAAFVSGTYNHDGRAVRMACKSLGIKHTRTSMEAYFEGRL